LAELDIETIQQRERRWVLADPEGKGRRIRTVAILIWVKQGINAWMIAAGIEDGRLLRSVSKSGKVNRDTLSDWAVWSVVEQSSKQIGIRRSILRSATRCSMNFIVHSWLMLLKKPRMSASSTQFTRFR
jgi:integrase